MTKKYAHKTSTKPKKLVSENTKTLGVYFSLTMFLGVLLDITIPMCFHGCISWTAIFLVMFFSAAVPFFIVKALSEYFSKMNAKKGWSPQSTPHQVIMFQTTMCVLVFFASLAVLAMFSQYLVMFFTLAIMILFWKVELTLLVVTGITAYVLIKLIKHT